MAYDEKLVNRVRRALAKHRGITERRMFGGIAFMMRGNMCVGVSDDQLMLRVGPAQYEAALGKPHVRPMDFTGRPMKGYIFVTPDGFATAARLRAWIERAVKFVKTLPAK